MTLTARHYDNAADILAGAYAVHMRLMMPRKPLKIIEGLPAQAALVAPPRPPVLDYYDAPTEAQIASEPKEHLKACHEWIIYRRTLTPINFVRLQCAIEGFSYEYMTSKEDRYIMGPIRKAIVRRTHERFPALSSPSLGKLFERDCSTILNTLGRLKVCKARAE